MKILSFLIAFAILPLVSPSAADATKPNVLCILVDDFVSALYETPHIDQVAKSGDRVGKKPKSK